MLFHYCRRLSTASISISSSYIK
uniref:Uncharacterized protein n=1 Tax=Anguilla anguilla TaxID=7936 RepID=A0A0E9TXH9_ANGAN